MKKTTVIFLIIFIAASIHAQDIEPSNTHADKLQINAMNSDKLYLGIAADLPGFLFCGPTISLEFTKNAFNAQVFAIFSEHGMYIHLLPLLFFRQFPYSAKGGFGITTTLNYFRHTPKGGSYIGGMFEYFIQIPGTPKEYWKTYTLHYFGLAVNIGYKFIDRYGLFFRIGANIGGGIVASGTGRIMGYSIFRPDISFGYNF